MLERPPVRQIRRDPRRPERVATGRGRQTRGRRPPLDHGQDETPGQRPARQPPTRRVDALEERHLRLVDPSCLEVVVERLDRPAVGRDVMATATLLVEPQPPPAPLLEVVLPRHVTRRGRGVRTVAGHLHVDEGPGAEAAPLHRCLREACKALPMEVRQSHAARPSWTTHLKDGPLVTLGLVRTAYKQWRVRRSRRLLPPTHSTTSGIPAAEAWV